MQVIGNYGGAMTIPRIGIEQPPGVHQRKGPGDA